MTDITELTAEKLEEIRQRYRPTLAPKCHICGVEMTIQRMSASRITYGCAGAIYDETGCHYAEGRSLADDHYAESRITVVDVSDPDVLAMVEALEKAQQRIIELVARKEKRLPVPYAYLRESDGQIQISIGADRPSDRSGGYSTPWFPIYTAAGIKVEQLS
ncbi:TPA: ead/Ea22-like family protein [Klebsiella variicola]|nr:ead/Ea22-like family protein [Klebsiella variicola]